VEEPAYQYVPEVMTLPLRAGGDALTQSMLLLEDGLASGAVLSQFEQLYRKKPGTPVIFLFISIQQPKRTQTPKANKLYYCCTGDGDPHTPNLKEFVLCLPLLIKKVFTFCPKT